MCLVFSCAIAIKRTHEIFAVLTKMKTCHDNGLFVPLPHHGKSIIAQK